MNLELCNKCASRYVMCFNCERNEYYREGRGSHDEYITRQTINKLRNLLNDAKFPHEIFGETQMIVLGSRIDEIIKEMLEEL